MSRSFSPEHLQAIAQPFESRAAQALAAGDARGAIADLVAIHRYQGDAVLEPLEEDDDTVTVRLAPCGSGGWLERQRLPERHPQAYGGWSDGVSGYCEGCKANQAALNEALGAPVWTTEKQADGGCTLRFAKLRQRGQVLFSAEERVALTLTRVRQAEERLAAGDTDLAPLLEGQRKEWQPWHDFAVVWLAHFYAIALELGGTGYLDELLSQTYAPAFVAGFRLHEEDDRFVFTLDPCGSGGRLFHGTMWRDLFHYGAPLSPLIDEPHPIDFQRKQAPSYCTHCAASNRTQLERADDPKTPLFFVIDGHAQQRPGMPCRTYVYKTGADRSRIDPALFAQIGLVPPGAARGTAAGLAHGAVPAPAASNAASGLPSGSPSRS